MAPPILKISSEKPLELKCTILGEGGVGKSTAVIRYVSNYFVEEYDPTIEDSYRKTVVNRDGQAVLLEMLDTAGREEFSALKDVWYQAADVCLICYSITSRQSFYALSSYLMHVEKARNLKQLEKAELIIMGTKADLESSREVTESEGRAFAKACGAAFLESSAKTNMGITDAFGLVATLGARRVLDRVNGKLQGRRKRPTICALQ
eukprot:CAMPEP_0177661060 /NCGR_PEP_ID=MMETSP0447-20121125/18432_1 /TAXON_ID=0 /ORGANISM="Stygamoeba regulata, Strain BSH-02190019" /LENGTH=205 /DNA_ID=CAMNT_0019166287 /DNA_START=129 /DNA_END=746 /DNA_ORIENTATION=-